MAALNLAGSAAVVPGGTKAFVPNNNKKPVEQFPVIGSTASKQPAAKKMEDEDPCRGMPKEFFIYKFNQMSNIPICTPEQLGFIAKHYPEWYKTPIDILIQLYEIALSYETYIDEQAVYTIGPKSKSQKKQDEDEDDYNNEGTTFIKSWRDLNKKPCITEEERRR